MGRIEKLPEQEDDPVIAKLNDVIQRVNELTNLIEIFVGRTSVPKNTDIGRSL